MDYTKVNEKTGNGKYPIPNVKNLLTYRRPLLMGNNI